MGTILPRKRKDGSTVYGAQILIKRNGAIVHRESETFDRKQAARAWLARRETELRKPGGLDRPPDPPLADVIERYVNESIRKIGRTKAQVLRTIKEHDIAQLPCSKITSADVVSFAQSLLARPIKPQTVNNYLSHLAAVFAVARPAWGYPLERQAIKDAMTVTKRLGMTRKSTQRDRRPTLDELDRLMDHFGVVKARRPQSVPMQKIVVFALFSTRRLEESPVFGGTITIGLACSSAT